MPGSPPWAPAHASPRHVGAGRCALGALTWRTFHVPATLLSRGRVSPITSRLCSCSEGSPHPLPVLLRPGLEARGSDSRLAGDAHTRGYVSPTPTLRLASTLVEPWEPAPSTTPSVSDDPTSSFLFAVFKWDDPRDPVRSNFQQTGLSLGQGTVTPPSRHMSRCLSRSRGPCPVQPGVCASLHLSLTRGLRGPSLHLRAGGLLNRLPLRFLPPR